MTQYTFKQTKGFKKRTRCIICGKMITIENTNQKKCIECGYRGHDK